MKVVKNLNTLKAMAKMGFVEFCDQTGEKIKGLYSSKTFTCYYVDDANMSFQYKGKTYERKFFDGCFYPYVVEIE